MSHTLTFDLGTTYFKTCLFDENEQLVASHRLASHFASEIVGRSELAVADFEACLCNGVQALARRHNLQQVKWVTFASQANTFTLLDANDEPLVPFISWTDARAGDQCRGCNAFPPRPDTMLPLAYRSYSAEFMIAKVRWLKEHEPKTRGADTPALLFERPTSRSG
jgi:xylulokinase